MNDYRKYSIISGLASAPLINPYTGAAIHPHDCGCGCGKLPAVSETELAARENQFPQLAAIEKKFFRETAKSVTKMESEYLEGLGLPTIAQVRRAVMLGERNTGEKWTWTREKEKALDDAVSSHLTRFIGAPYDQIKTPKVKPEDMPLYVWFQLQAMAVGISITMGMLESAPSRPSILTTIQADPDMLRFRAMRQAAGDRIRTALARESLPKVRRYLEQMAIDGEWAINVARRLHDDIGEGDLWYWRRITRTEGTLANNLAYDMMCEANNVLYDEWICGATACIICTQFNGEVWRHGEGPYPVEDTHPSCGCSRIAQYEPGRGDVSERWTRESPYDNPYTPDEVEAIRQRLNTVRTDL